MQLVDLSDAPTGSCATTPAFRVALVCMPFAFADRPSVQIGLIGAVCDAAGFPADLFHFNLDLARDLGTELYQDFCRLRSHMTGEWLFAPAAFGAEAPGDEASYLHSFPAELQWATGLGKDVGFLTQLRRQLLPEFIDRCFSAVDWSQYGVVGFSSLFQQNVASLALARRIKEQHPGVHIVFGGSNMDGEMGAEYARAFPVIDYVVSGEGDETFPKLLQTLAARKKVLRIPGVVVRTPLGLSDGGPAAPVHDLDRLPIPNYTPYFERAGALGILGEYRRTLTLPYESSRGCWWGQKHHCTFCGLNGNDMRFRSKRPKRVLSELSELARRHRVSSFAAVDNILDLKYIKEFCGEIEESKLDYRLFYEVKANLKREQLRSLFRGGVRCIQPGIESMSTHVLALMRKGCTMLQNVRCLKWCMYYGISVNWNLIWGFPGETEQDYQLELKALQSLTHLEPPTGCSRIWLERFSPHFTDPAFPVMNKRPEASYRHVYPAHVDLMKAAYFFDYEMGNTLPDSSHVATKAHVESWGATWSSERRHSLSYRKTHDGLFLDVNRGEGHRHTLHLEGAVAEIYECCGETMQGLERIADHLRAASTDYDYELGDIQAALDEFCRAQLMLSEDGQYLSLALPANPNW